MEIVTNLFHTHEREEFGSPSQVHQESVHGHMPAGLENSFQQTSCLNP